MENILRKTLIEICELQKCKVDKERGETINKDAEMAAIISDAAKKGETHVTFSSKMGFNEYNFDSLRMAGFTVFEYPSSSCPLTSVHWNYLMLGDKLTDRPINKGDRFVNAEYSHLANPDDIFTVVQVGKTKVRGLFQAHEPVADNYASFLLNEVSKSDLLNPDKWIQVNQSDADERSVATTAK